MPEYVSDGDETAGDQPSLDRISVSAEDAREIQRELREVFAESRAKMLLLDLHESMRVAEKMIRYYPDLLEAFYAEVRAGTAALPDFDTSDPIVNDRILHYCFIARMRLEKEKKKRWQDAVEEIIAACV